MAARPLPSLSSVWQQHVSLRRWELRARTLEISREQIVLNDTPAPLTVAKILYGTTFAEPDERHVEPYGSVKLGGRIDHFGPADLPPATSDKWERYWVRW